MNLGYNIFIDHNSYGLVVTDNVLLVVVGPKLVQLPAPNYLTNSKYKLVRQRCLLLGTQSRR